VQVLVDTVSWVYPIMAYSSGLSFQMGLIGVMVLTMCYQGLFDLSKRFLDPFHNENFWNGDDPIMIDTLIAQTNAGSLRWIYGLESMPVPMVSIQTGRLNSFVLPDEGYTVEEATQREKERVARRDSRVKRRPGGDEEEEEEEEISYQQEFEEAQAILNAPPGYDFVPGIDDVGESLSYMTGNANATETILSDGVEEEYTDPVDVYEQFIETSAEEFAALEGTTTEPDP